MKKVLISLLLVLGVCASSVQAQEARATKEEAKAMCEKAATWYKEKGKEATFAAINDVNNKEFHDRELYLFVYDKDGVNIAHGQKASLIGKNLIDLKDSDGNYMIKAIVGVATTGWVDFKWANPVTQAVEAKSAYVIHEGDAWFGVGVYKPAE